MCRWRSFAKPNFMHWRLLEAIRKGSFQLVRRKLQSTYFLRFQYAIHTDFHFSTYSNLGQPLSGWFSAKPLFDRVAEETKEGYLA
jgi:hypothetical protein